MLRGPDQFFTQIAHCQALVNELVKISPNLPLPEMSIHELICHEYGGREMQGAVCIHERASVCAGAGVHARAFLYVRK